ncbi:cyclic nucleotide-binding domain-containing protein [Paenibacillus algorifonticola]|uniref:Crp/Fnr family transcriptional regulator n=1 Tax=Paenibacillus algorifonticola TaxID=684063 RepID=UPI003D2A52A2
MIEIKDRELLGHYLQLHQLESVFSELLLPHLTLYSFEQEELICGQGETPQHMFVLVKGKIKVYTNSPEGKTLIISFKTPLEVIGDVEYIRGTEFLNTVEAVSPVIMIGVQHRWLNKHGRDYAPLLRFLLEKITRKFYFKANSMSLNVMQPVEVRLASYFLSVSYDESDAQFKGELSTDNLKDVANLIGTSYRHLNRVIRRFCEEGLVERTKQWIVIKNKDALSKRANHHIYTLTDQKGEQGQ